jgi:hypothetical protein
MSVANKSDRTGRRFSFEPLEDRSLLSGLEFPSADLAAPDHNSADAPETVQVLEITPAEEADEEGDSAREIAISELPEQVVSAVSARFPGARLLEAETDSDGGSLTFDVRAEWSGTEWALTISPEGDVMEIERPLASADLPQAVRDWIASNFPGASIREADLVAVRDAVSYEVLIATATGSFEATLLVPAQEVPIPGAGLDARAISPSESPDVFDNGRPGQATSTGGSALDALEHLSAVSSTEPVRAAALVFVPATAGTEPQQPPGDSPQGQAESGQEPTDRVSLTDSPSDATVRQPFAEYGAAADQTAALSATLRPIVSGIAAATWLPQVAQALGDVFPLEMAAIELGLEKFLDEVDSLADMLVLSETSRVTPRLLVAAAVLVGAERLITQMNKTKGGPVLNAAAGKSTWTWVLNLSGPRTPSD